MPFCRDPDLINHPSPGVNKKKYVAAQYKGIQPYGNGNKNKFIKSNVNEVLNCFPWIKKRNYDWRTIKFYLFCVWPQRNDYNVQQRNKPLNNKNVGFDSPKPYQKKNVGTPKKVAPRPPGTSFGDNMFNNNNNNGNRYDSENNAIGDSSSSRYELSSYIIVF